MGGKVQNRDTVSRFIALFFAQYTDEVQFFNKNGNAIWAEQRFDPFD